MTTDINVIKEELRHGGEWLRKSREWIRWNIQRGDQICWDSMECVHVPFKKLQEFAFEVASFAIKEDRKKQKRIT